MERCLLNKINYPSPQYKKCFAVVEIGGGKTKLIEDGETARTSMMDFIRPDAIVMEPNLDRSSQAFGAEVKLALQKVRSLDIVQ